MQVRRSYCSNSLLVLEVVVCRELEFRGQLCHRQSVIVIFITIHTIRSFCLIYFFALLQLACMDLIQINHLSLICKRSFALTGYLLLFVWESLLRRTYVTTLEIYRVVERSALEIRSRSLPVDFFWCPIDCRATWLGFLISHLLILRLTCLPIIFLFRLLMDAALFGVLVSHLVVLRIGLCLIV